MFLPIPRAHKHGQICIYGFMGKICPEKKLLHFYNPTCTHQKSKYKRLCVPIHFVTNRFTFEKFPPPPPLLHPTYSVYLTFVVSEYVSRKILRYRQPQCVPCAPAPCYVCGVLNRILALLVRLEGPTAPTWNSHAVVSTWCFQVVKQSRSSPFVSRNILKITF